MDIRRIATLDDRGIRVRVKVVKNKVAAPYKKAEFDILFGGGISKVGSLLDAAEEAAIVERRGAWYGFGETRLGQGRDKAVEFLKDNEEVRREVEGELCAALGLPREGGGARVEVEEAEAAKAE
jgi:recombination protein RecA